jgi:hypothetical protein
MQSVMHWGPGESANTNTNSVLNANGTPDGAGDKPGSGPALPGNSTLLEGRDPAADDLSFWPSIAFAFAVGALALWFGFGWGAEIESEVVAGHRGCTNRSDPIFDL